MTGVKIEEVSKLTGLTKRAIRYYEQIGLIDPPERTEGRIRLYTDDDISRLQKVVDAKEVLGFSLQELQHYLSLNETIEQYRNEYRESKKEHKSSRELDKIAKGLQKQEAMIDEKIEKMLQFKKEVHQLYQKVTAILD